LTAIDVNLAVKQLRPTDPILQRLDRVASDEVPWVFLELPPATLEVPREVMIALVPVKMENGFIIEEKINPDGLAKTVKLIASSLNRLTDIVGFSMCHPNSRRINRDLFAFRKPARFRRKGLIFMFR
jgi:hypothetical protein